MTILGAIKNIFSVIMIGMVVFFWTVIGFIGFFFLFNFIAIGIAWLNGILL